MGARMGGDQGSIGEPGHVPEAFFVQMREVDEDTQLIASADEGHPRGGQSRPGIG